MLFRSHSSAHATHNELQEILVDLIEHRRLHAVLQPIVATRSGEIVGYEGLIRGPVDSPLHMPAWLFSVAERFGLESAVEHLSREIVLETFVALDLPGKLFLNVSPELLTQTASRDDNFVARKRRSPAGEARDRRASHRLDLLKNIIATLHENGVREASLNKDLFTSGRLRAAISSYKRESRRRCIRRCWIDCPRREV